MTIARDAAIVWFWAYVVAQLVLLEVALVLGPPWLAWRSWGRWRARKFGAGRGSDTKGEGRPDALPSVL